MLWTLFNAYHEHRFYFTFLSIIINALHGFIFHAVDIPMSCRENPDRS